MAESPLVQPLPFRVLVDEAMGRVRRHFRDIYLPVAVPLALVASLLPIAQGLWMRDMVSRRTPDLASMAPRVAAFFLVLAVFLIVYALAHGALLVAAVDALAGRPISMSRAWTTMLRPRLFGTQLLALLLLSLGFACCVLPGIYLALLLSFVTPVMVEEGVFGPRALRRSRDLARHNPQGRMATDPRFHVFLMIFIGFLIGYMVGFVIQFPLMVVQQVLMMRMVAEGRRPDPAEMMAAMTWLQVPSQALGMLAQTAVQLYVSFGLAQLFFDVRHRREGGDLEAAIAALEARA